MMCSLVDMNLLQIDINNNMQQVSKIVSIVSYLMGTRSTFPTCKVTTKLMTCLTMTLRMHEAIV